MTLDMPLMCVVGSLDNPVQMDLPIDYSFRLKDFSQWVDECPYLYQVQERYLCCRKPSMWC